ncbi:MAG: hypothetical protein RL021_2209 [Bacteroidota bacterium]|jgi:hypothetical protein
MDEKELAEKLASGEYSISPRSGRLRKRIRKEKKKKKRPLYSKKKLDKLMIKVVWVLMIIALIASIAILFPELNNQSVKNKPGQTLPFKRN